MNSILAIPGSLRHHSYNRMLLRAVVDLAPAGLSVRLWDDLPTIPLFDEDLEAEPARIENVRRFAEQVSSADGVLIATPEYNWSVPGVLKNAIDWLSRPTFNVLVGKPIAIIGASSGRWGTRLAQANLRQVLTATESLVLPTPAVFVSDAAACFDASGQLIDVVTRTQVETFLVAFKRWINLPTRDTGEGFVGRDRGARSGAAHV